MNKNDRKNALLKYLDINCWRIRKKSENNIFVDYSLYTQYIYTGNKLSNKFLTVILSSYKEIEHVKNFINAMFSSLTVLIVDINEVKIQQNIVLGSIIFCEENSQIDSLLKKNVTNNCYYSFNFNKFSDAKVKRHAMMKIYEISSFFISSDYQSGK